MTQRPYSAMELCAMVYKSAVIALLGTSAVGIVWLVIRVVIHGANP